MTLSLVKAFKCICGMSLVNYFYQLRNRRSQNAKSKTER